MTAPRQMPEGHYEYRLHNGVKPAALHYKAARDTVRKWDRMLTEAQRSAVAAASEDRSRSGLIEERKRQRIARQSRRKSPALPAAQRMLVASGVAEPKPGCAKIEGAKHYLRRHYANVFDAGLVYGKALAGVFVVGNERVDAAGLLALAADKGFDPDAWRRLA